MLASEFQQSSYFEFRCIQLRPDFLIEARDQGVFPPLRADAQGRHRGSRFLTFTDAFEWLVILVFQQRVEPADLRCVVQQVTTKNVYQARLGHEWRQGEKHKMAFGADTAPAIDRAFAEDVEIAIATGEVRIVVIGLGELASDRQFRQRTQQ